MPTVTLDLPEPAMARLLSMPEPERNRFVADLILDEDEDEEITFVTEPYDFTPLNINDLSPGDRAAVLRGLADVEAGRVKPLAEAMAEIEADFQRWVATRAK